MEELFGLLLKISYICSRNQQISLIMETNKTTYTQRTPEEIKAWFKRAKARIAAREAEIRAVYEEELRMKAEAERKHVYDLEAV